MFLKATLSAHGEGVGGATSLCANGLEHYFNYNSATNLGLLQSNLISPSLLWGDSHCLPGSGPSWSQSAATLLGAKQVKLILTWVFFSHPQIC